MSKRNTIQRKIVFDAVKDLANHPTSNDIYDHVVTSHPNISRGTVYRNLNSLAEDGYLRKICIPDGADRFDHTVMPHYHIKCTSCGKFTDLDMEYMKDLDDKVRDVTGYEMESQDIVFRGICPNCRHGLREGVIVY